MYLIRGTYAPTYRPVPVSAAKSEMRPVNTSPLVPQAEPFMFTRLFLVTGVLLAGVVIVALVSA